MTSPVVPFLAALVLLLAALGAFPGLAPFERFVAAVGCLLALFAGFFALWCARRFR